jgi:hypothetical protein
MNTYLLALGWWNLVGCFLMFGFFNEAFGNKMLNEWTKIFVKEYKLDHWSRFWMFWAIGLNIFFAVTNIMAADWNYPEVKQFLIGSDIVAYTLFLGLALWGINAGKCASGIYSVIVIFMIWISWGVYALFN